MGMLILLAILGLLVGTIAQSKGRRFLPWFVYGMLLFIVAFFHVLFIGSIGKTCPRCFSSVPRPATVCMHCQYKFTPADFKAIQDKETKIHQHDTRNWLIVIVCFIVIVLILNYAFTGHI